MMGVRISDLVRYVIKSCAGESLSSTELDERGIVGDRMGMIADKNGKFLSQRQIPKMALIRPELIHSQPGDTLVLLQAPGMPELLHSVSLQKRAAVHVQQDLVEAYIQLGEVAEWLSTFLHTACDLVWMGDDFNRPVDGRYAAAKQVGFHDGFPLLLTHEPSLTELNCYLEEPVPMDRFRPNVVTTGDTIGFAEDQWKVFQPGINAPVLEAVKPCARCEITCVDQQTGERTGHEPLRTLTKFRLLKDPVSGKKGPMFGQNLIIHERGNGWLHVGDRITVFDYQPPLAIN